MNDVIGKWEAKERKTEKERNTETDRVKRSESKGANETPLNRLVYLIMHLSSVVWSDINKLDSILMHLKMEKNLNSICAWCGFIEHMHKWTRDYWREANNLTFCQKLFTLDTNRKQIKDTACNQQTVTCVSMDFSANSVFVTLKEIICFWC